MLCPKCGKEITEEDGTEFCGFCGAKINYKSINNPASVKPRPDDETGIKPKLQSPKGEISPLIMSIGIIVILIVIFLVVVPTKTITKNVEIAYTDTETYYEKEPYEVQEAYQEQEPYQSVGTYTDTVPVPVSVPYQDYEYSYQSSTVQSGRYYATIPSTCSCTSTRYMYDKDNIYGALCVQIKCLISTPVTKYRTEMQQQSIQKERPVTKYQTVTKYRTVTNYRDIPKTRQVVKFRTEPQQSEINWVLGFKTPYKLHLPFISGD